MYPAQVSWLIASPFQFDPPRRNLVHLRYLREHRHRFISHDSQRCPDQGSDAHWAARSQLSYQTIGKTIGKWWFNAGLMEFYGIYPMANKQNYGHSYFLAWWINYEWPLLIAMLVQQRGMFVWAFWDLDSLEQLFWRKVTGPTASSHGRYNMPHLGSSFSSRDDVEWTWIYRIHLRWCAVSGANKQNTCICEFPLW